MIERSPEEQDQAREDLFVILIRDGESLRDVLRLVTHYFPEV